MREIAPQSTVTKGLLSRALTSWIALATAPLPVPVSPTIRIVALVGATRSSSAKILRIGSDFPTREPNEDDPDGEMLTPS